MTVRYTQMRRPANTITNTLNPFFVFTALYVLVALAESALDRALLYVGIELAAAGAVAGYVLWLRRRSQVGDFWISRRAERLVPAAFTILASAVLILSLYFLHAPEGLFRATISMGLATVVSAAITLFWKISAHSSVAGHATVAGFLLLGPAGVVFLLTLPLVLWSRVATKAHTLPQVFAGAVLGAVLALSFILG